MEFNYFEVITEEWFDENGVVPTEAAYLEWEMFVTKRSSRLSEETMFRKLLSIASGKDEVTIRNYLHPKKERKKKVGEATARILDTIVISLNKTPPQREKKAILYKKHQLALITELSFLPSVHYHRNAIQSIVKGAQKFKYAVTIHEVYNQSIKKTVKRVIQSYRPDGIIIIRLPLDKKSLELLANEEIPTVLFHSDRNPFFTNPIAGNIVPVFTSSNLESTFGNWVDNILQYNSTYSKKVVLAHMELIDRHRKDKVDFITGVLKKRNIEFSTHIVKNYGFENALEIVENHPNAPAFICLQDQIAVGIKHLLKVTKKPYQHRISGFDNSKIAKEYNISSFDQKLEESGMKAVEYLHQYFHKIKKPPFKNIEVEVSFCVRG